MKTKQFKLGFLGLMVTSLIGFTSCEKDDNKTDDPDHDHDEELITTVKLTFTDSATQVGTTFQFKDIDGEGGNDPEIFDEITLLPNRTYNLSMQFLNESESPAEDITAEILEEDDEHIICFIPANSNVTIKRTDSDGTNEVGLESKWTTKAESSGTVAISLKHQPGVKDGSCTPGETDVELTFDLEIKTPQQIGIGVLVNAEN